MPFIKQLDKEQLIQALKMFANGEAMEPHILPDQEVFVKGQRYIGI